MNLRYKLLASLLLVSFIGMGLSSPQASGEVEAAFEITYLSPTGNAAREAYSLLLVNEFPKAGIGISDHVIVPFSEMGARAWGYPTYPVPTFDGGGFDALSVGLGGALSYDPTGLFDSPSVVPNGINLWDYTNPDFDAVLSTYTQTLSAADRVPLAAQMQAMLYEDLPSLPIYYTANLHVVDSGSEWDETDVLFLATTNTATQWAELGHPTDKDFVWGHFYDLIEFHPLVVAEYISVSFLNPIFPGLYERDKDDAAFDYRPALADGEPVWNNDNTVATIDINPAATFSNGNPVTAQDVKNSYEFYITAGTGSQQVGNIISFLASNDSIQVIDSDTVEFTFEAPYFLAKQTLSFGIMDDAVIGTLDAPLGDGADGFDFNSDPVKFSVGAGPFTMDSVDDAGGNVKLVAVDNWWGGDVNLDSIEFKNFANKDAVLTAARAGDVNYIDNNYVVEPAEIAEDTNLRGIEKVVTGGVQQVAINLNHPVIGTGVDTPLGKEDPSRAWEAAKHVRKAMSHMIPREQIVADILKGNGATAITNWPKSSATFDSSLPEWEYSVDLAKAELELAGYEIKEVEEGFLPLADIIPLMFAAFVTSALIIRRRR